MIRQPRIHEGRDSLAAAFALEIGDSGGARLIDRNLGGGHPNHPPVAPGRNRVAGEFMTKQRFANRLRERLLDAMSSASPSERDAVESVDRIIGTAPKDSSGAIVTATTNKFRYVSTMSSFNLPGIHHYLLPGVPDLIAGEYPGHPDEAHALERLRLLRLAGVTMFLDLTEDGELVPYAPLLEAVEDDLAAPAAHRRFPIRDVRVPHPPSFMADILDEIDRAREEGHLVYLHCWGGVGRTGTVAGCYLVRQGWSGEAALAEVGRLFAETEKGRHGLIAPETAAQADFIRRWQEPGAGRPSP